MIQFLYTIDKAVFLFFNQTLSSPVGDVMWPLITEFDKFWVVRLLLLGMWLWLLIRGGRTGRIAAFLIIVVIFLSDTLSSAVLKELIGRQRPCHDISGVPVVQGIHLLVNCGSGRSFPSSHAVNNFAAAALFAYFYRRWTWAFLAWAFLVSLSRVAVGVHYPSDIIGGAILGILIAGIVVWIWLLVEKRFFPVRDRHEGQQEVR